MWPAPRGWDGRALTVLGDHGDYQVAPSRVLGRDEFLYSELANHRQHGVDMAMR